MTNPVKKVTTDLANKVAEEVKQTEEKYALFMSTRPAFNMVMPNGKKVCFAKHKFMTKDEDVIQFLEGEIAAGIIDARREDDITNNEAIDPNFALRMQIREEERAKLLGQAQPAGSPGRSLDALATQGASSSATVAK